MVWLNRALAALLVVGAVAFLPGQWPRTSVSDDVARVEAERQELVGGNAALAAEIELLEAEVGALHQDPADPRGRRALDDEIERIAREDLNLVRAGEVVFEVRRPVDARP